MSAHTPGPWVIDDGHSNKTGKYGYFVRAHKGAIWDDGSADGGVCSMADARLIAAAPDLLEALQEVTDVLDMALGIQMFGLRPDADWPAAKARAAIAKATGQ